MLTHSTQVQSSSVAALGLDPGLVTARGDDTFDHLVRQHGPRMRAVARRLLGSDEDAQDAVQDALLAAYRSIDSFCGHAKLSTWLHRIVVNAALMKLRSRRRRPEESVEDALPGLDGAGGWATLATEQQGPADLLQRAEARTQVRRCIAQLPDAYRTVLVLRDIEDRDTDEVACALGITPNAVKIRLHRARQALRLLLAPAVGAALN